jgi:hypothetical protein
MRPLDESAALAHKSAMNGRRIAATCALLALAVGCKKDEPSAAPTTSASASASSASPSVTALASAALPAPTASSAATPTGPLSRFLPKDGQDGWKRSGLIDNPGLAEVKLQKDGKDVATLQIVDAEKLHFQKAKFADVTDKLDGFPIMKIGADQSSVLVKDKYIVKVTSTTLDHEARKAILAKVDLKGLGG